MYRYRSLPRRSAYLVLIRTWDRSFFGFRKFMGGLLARLKGRAVVPSSLGVKKYRQAL